MTIKFLTKEKKLLIQEQNNFQILIKNL